MKKYIVEFYGKVITYNDIAREIAKEKGNKENVSTSRRWSRKKKILIGTRKSRYE